MLIYFLHSPAPSFPSPLTFLSLLPPFPDSDRGSSEGQLFQKETSSTAHWGSGAVAVRSQINSTSAHREHCWLHRPRAHQGSGQCAAQGWGWCPSALGCLELCLGNLKTARLQPQTFSVHFNSSSDRSWENYSISRFNNH